MMAISNIATIRTVARIQTLSTLKEYFGEHFQDGLSQREQHGHTTTRLTNQPPEAVIFPEKTDDIVRIVNLCRESRTPIIPFGAGTSLEGHLNAPMGA